MSTCTIDQKKYHSNDVLNWISLIINQFAKVLKISGQKTRLNDDQLSTYRLIRNNNKS